MSSEGPKRRALTGEFLLSRSALPIVAVLFGTGLALTYAQLSHNHRVLIERTALQHAAVYSHTLDRFRSLYASEVVETARKSGLKISHDYLTEQNAIPLPITLTNELDGGIATEGVKTTMYSPFPFAWREGGLKDEFARDAWEALNQNPDQPYYRTEKYNGVLSLRYAISERMKEECVDCHNTYDGSPKMDWRVGDVRGVLEVVYPLDQAERLARGSIWETLGILSPMMLLALTMLGLTLKQHRRWNSTLQQKIRAQERTLELEEEVRQAQRMQAVGRLAGGVAHDFNNELTVIRSFTTYAIRRLEPEDPSYSDLQHVLGAANRGEALTRQLLAFSRQKSVHPRVVNVNTLVGGMDAMLARLVGKRVRLDIDLAPELPNVRLPAGAIDQVVMNLALNARDAMPDGGKLTIRTSRFSVSKGTGAENAMPAILGDYVCLTVSDDGVGMDEETRRSMFDPFFTTKGPGKGTGLGLSTCWGIVRQANGHILVESEPGRGTTIRVLLPVVYEEVEDSGEFRRPSNVGGSETVLVVEDNDNLREAVVRALTEAGYKVFEAVDGEEAADIAEGFPPDAIDLLLTDVVMPGLDGPALAEKVIRMHPAIRVLYISGFTDDAVLRQGQSQSRVYFLQKPFEPDVLLGKVRKVLDAAPTIEERA